VFTVLMSQRHVGPGPLIALELSASLTPAAPLPLMKHP
jgi:hypothetical protein